MKRKHVYRFLEFFIVGLVMGIVEDLIAVGAATGMSINWNIVAVVAMVALPFAIFSELIVDHEDFPFFRKKRK